jgi:hypothetical protein
MIDRSALVRGFVVLLLLAAACSSAYAMLSDTDGTSGTFLEDDPTHRYGPIYEEPNGYRDTLLADRWVRSIKVSGGGTFGSTITRQVRIGIEGRGPIPEREATLETRAAIVLFAGPRRERAEGVLRGIQNTLDDRGGLVRGVSLAQSPGEAQSAAIASIVRLRAIDDFSDPGDRAILTKLLADIGADQSKHAFAWYNGQFQEIVLGPEVSRGLLTWIRTPKQATKQDNIFTAFVLRHELEHAVTPIGDRDYRQLQWMEEGTADTMARWPGAAAETARMLGMPYPTRYDRLQFATKRGGYPEWTDTIRVLLGAAGIDWKDPAQFDAASRLLQSRDSMQAPTMLAERIAKRNRMGADGQTRIERDIRRLDGDVRAARRLVARL